MTETIQNWRQWEMDERLEFYKRKDASVGGRMPTDEELRAWRVECDEHIASARAAQLHLPWSLGDDGLTIRDAEGRLVVARGECNDVSRARACAQLIIEAVNAFAPDGLIHRLSEQQAMAWADNMALRKALDYVHGAIVALHARGENAACPFCGAAPDVPDSAHDPACPRYVIGYALHRFIDSGASVDCLRPVVHRAGDTGPGPEEG